MVKYCQLINKNLSYFNHLILTKWQQSSQSIVHRFSAVSSILILPISVVRFLARSPNMMFIGMFGMESPREDK